jgi:hypothetical protein
MGVNMMNPARRTEVLESARASAAVQVRRELASSDGWGRRGRSEPGGPATSGSATA